MDDNVVEVKEMPDRRGSSRKWHEIPYMAGLVGAVLSALLSIAFFTFSRTVENGDKLSGDREKIANLQSSVEGLKIQVTNMQSSFVTVDQFNQFKAYYEQNQQRMFANDSRIENKLDILLMEHAKGSAKMKPSKAKTEEQGVVFMQAPSIPQLTAGTRNSW
jgi:hypothetical protein